MKPIKEIQDIINGATSTDSYHKYSPLRGYPVATDGVIALAEAVGCYWLLDVIGSHQSNRKLDKAFQVWVLNVDADSNSAVVQGLNDTTPIVKQQIPFTDFPLQELKLYLMDGVILLPCEY